MLCYAMLYYAMLYYAVLCYAILTLYYILLLQIPSHLFEYFARDARVLRKWARHRSTGEPIPEELLQAVTAHRNPHGGMLTAMQLFYAAVDQVHGLA
jgi:hypothetical protein